MERAGGRVEAVEEAAGVGDAAGVGEGAGLSASAYVEEGAAGARAARAGS